MERLVLLRSRAGRRRKIAVTKWWAVGSWGPCWWAMTAGGFGARRGGCARGTASEKAAARAALPFFVSEVVCKIGYKEFVIPIGNR